MTFYMKNCLGTFVSSDIYMAGICNCHHSNMILRYMVHFAHHGKLAIFFSYFDLLSGIIVLPMVSDKLDVIVGIDMSLQHISSTQTVSLHAC